MRRLPSYSLLFPLVLVSPALYAAAPISGTMNHTENFDTLPAVTTPWTNNVTLPNWYAARQTGTITDIVPTNGSGTWTANLQSLATVGLPADRALGTTPTTSQGDYFIAVVFQNTGAQAIRLTELNYSPEVYRASSSTTVPEPLAVHTRVSAVESDLTSNANLILAPAANGWINQPALLFTHPADPTVDIFFDPPVGTPVIGVPDTAVIIPPGSFVAIRWFNNNEGASDVYFGIDDVVAKFAIEGTGISGVATNVVRNQNGTPGDPADDSVTFSLTVTGAGVGPTWTTDGAPPEGGAYGASVPITRPVGTGIVTVNVSDVNTPTLTTPVIVNVPLNDMYIQAAVGTGAPNIQVPTVTFTDAAANGFNLFRTEPMTRLGFTTNNRARAIVRTQPAPNNAAKYFGMSDAGAAGEEVLFTTERVNLALVPDQYRVEVNLAAYTTSGTAFEAGDRIDVIVETSVSGDFTDAVEAGKLVDSTVTDGIALFNEIHVTQTDGNPSNNAPGINYGVVTDTSKTAYPTAAFGFVPKSGIFSKGAANFVRVKITGGNDSTAEFTLIDNIVFSLAGTAITPIVTNMIRNDNGTEDLTDDSVEFDITVTAELGSPSGWISDIPKLPSGTWSGAYATPVHVITPVTGLSATYTVTDATTTTATATLPAIPVPLYFGSVIVNGAPTSRINAMASQGINVLWRNDGTNTLRHDGNVATSSFTSNAVDISTATGTTQFNATLEASEVSLTSGFEATDLFRIELLLTKPDTTVDVLNLAQTHIRNLNSDANINGNSTNYDTDPNIDEFNIALALEAGQSGGILNFSFPVPPGTYNSVRVRVVGGTVGGTVTNGIGNNTETFKLSNISLAYDTTGGEPDSLDDAWELANFGNLNQTPQGDFDGDGSSNQTEFLAGTEPDDSTSRLALTVIGITGPNFTATWSSVAGKNYQIQVSPDLVTPWTDVGTVIPSQGTTTSVTAPVPGGLGVRGYMRVRVVP